MTHPVSHSPFKLRVPVVIFRCLSPFRVHLANQTPLRSPVLCLFFRLETSDNRYNTCSTARQHTFSNLQSETFLCSVHLGPSMIPPLLSRVIRFLPASQGFDKWPCASGPTPHFPPLQALPVNVPILSVMYNGAQRCQTALNEIVFSFIVPLPVLRQSDLRMDISIEMPL